MTLGLNCTSLSRFVALAEALDCVLVTADERLASAAGPRCAFRVLR